MNLSSYPGSVLHPRFGTQILDSTESGQNLVLRGPVRCLKLQKLISMMSGNRSKNQRTLNDSDCTSDRQNGAPMYQLSPRPAQSDDHVPIQGSMDHNVTKHTSKNVFFILLSLFYKTC